MPAEEIGTLAQAVLQAYNKLAELRASGAGQLAIRVAENALEKAKLAQQMATGSQQGMNLLGGGGMMAFGLPQGNLPLGTILQKAGTPGGGISNEGPLGKIFAGLFPSLFGTESPLAAQPSATPLPGTAQAVGLNSPPQSEFNPVGMQQFLASERGPGPVVQGSQFPGSPQGPRLPIPRPSTPRRTVPTASRAPRQAARR